MPGLRITPNQIRALAELELAVFDVDNTLVFANDPDFYQQYGTAVEAAIGQHYGVDRAQATKVANYYRRTYGGGEQALFQGNAHRHFPQLPLREKNLHLLYDELIQIDPTGNFTPQPVINAGIQALRADGLKIVALTSSPEPLSRRILEESGYDPVRDFDDFIAYTRDGGPPKMFKDKHIFTEITNDHSLVPEHVIAVGDSLQHDVVPALELGMMACLLATHSMPGYQGMLATHPLEIISAIHAAQSTESTWPA
jgi:FMN phosphatase YigB (HAD superfamily)